MCREGELELSWYADHGCNGLEVAADSAESILLGFKCAVQQYRTSRESIQMNEYDKGDFSLWKYTISHSSLLIRRPKAESRSLNSDVVFVGVEFICLPLRLSDFVVETANADDVSRISQIANSPVDPKKCFVLVEGGLRLHFVIALQCVREENDLDMFEARFDI
jgi:hypothetical protein